VSHDLEHYQFNTIVSSLMELTNTLIELRASLEGSEEWREAMRLLLLMMAPVTPHIAEECWSLLGWPYSVHRQSWPAVDEAAALEELITLVVQVNGKVRDRLQVEAHIGEEEAKTRSLAAKGVQPYLDGKTPKKIVYVPGRLVNVVV
jgi:leucyl-tRNA synthetase